MKQNNLKPRKVIKVSIENPQEEPVLVEAMNKAGFSEREFKVFKQYFYSGKSHRKVGEDLGVCRKRVVFLKKRALKRFKETLPEFPYRLFKERRRKRLAYEAFKKQLARTKKK